MTQTTKEMIAVMQAFEDGMPIEMTNAGRCGWRATPNPKWNWINFDYRVATTKPSIDWSHVGANLNAMVTEPHGRSWLTNTIPVNGSDDWMGGGIYIPAETFASFTPGTCDWQDSLVVRPGYEETVNGCQPKT